MESYGEGRKLISLTAVESRHDYSNGRKPILMLRERCKGGKERPTVRQRSRDY